MRLGRTVVLTLSSFALVVSLLSMPAKAQSDTTPPRLVSLSVSPTQIDASSSTVNVVVTAVITDDLSGLSYEGDSTSADYTSRVDLYSPSGNQSVVGCPCFTLVSGDTYTETLTFPRYSEQGIWKDWSLFLADEVGNTVWLDAYNVYLAGINQAVGVDPFETSYARRVSLNIGKTKATGSVSADVASSCYWFVPVLLQRKTKSGWKNAGRALADYNGYYRIPIRMMGRYRATATTFGIGTPAITTCSKASVVRTRK